MDFNSTHPSVAAKFARRQKRLLKRKRTTDHGPLPLVDSSTTNERWLGFSAFVDEPCVVNDLCLFHDLQHLRGLLLLRVVIADDFSKLKVFFTLPSGSRIPRALIDEWKLHNHIAHARHLLERFAFRTTRAIFFELQRYGCYSPEERPRQAFEAQSGDLLSQIDRADYETTGDYEEAVQELFTMASGNIQTPSTHMRWLGSLTGLLEEIAALVGAYRSAVTIPLRHRQSIRRNDLARAFYHFFKFTTGSNSISSHVHKWFDAILLEAMRPYKPQSSFTDTNIPLFTLFTIPFLLKDVKKPLEATSRAYRAFKGVGGGEDMADLAYSVWDFLKWLLETGLQAFEERDFGVFFHTRESYTDWFDEATSLQHDIYRVGLDVDYDDYVRRLDTCLLQSESVIGMLKAKRTPLLMHAVRQQEALQGVRANEILYHAARQSKPSPFFISFYGTPKSGKTQFIPELLAVFFKHIDKKFDSSMIYTSQPASRFADGLRSCHRAFIMDDVATVDPATGPNECIAELRSLMELANPIAPATHQADLADKGRVFARPDIVVVTSNDPYMGARHKILNHPAALLRRIRYRVHLHVKPEFCMVGSNGQLVNMIDENKVCGAQNIHTFSVYEYRMQGKPRNPNSAEDDSNGAVTTQAFVLSHEFQGSITPLQEVPDYVFFDWFQTVVKQHRAHATSVADSAQKHAAAQMCDSCHMLETRCRCKQFTPQGNCMRRSLDRVTAKALEQQKNVFLGKAKRSIRDAYASFGFSCVSWGGFMPRFHAAIQNHHGLLQSLFRILTTGFVLKTLATPDDPVDRGVKTMEPQSSKYQDYLNTFQKGTENVWATYDEERAIGLTSVVYSTRHTDLCGLVAKQSLTFVRGGQDVGALALGDGLYLTAGHFLKDDLDLPIGVIRQGKVLNNAMNYTVVNLNEKHDLVLIRSEFAFGKSLLPYVPMSHTPVRTNVKYIHDGDAFPNEDTTLHPFLWDNQTWSSGTRMFYADDAVRANGACGGICVADHNSHGYLAALHIAGAKQDFITTRCNSILAPLSLETIFGDSTSARHRLFQRPKVVIGKNGMGQCPDLPSTTKVHPRSHVGYLQANGWKPPPHVRVLGSVEYPSSKFTTSYIETPLKEHLGVKTEKVPPVFRQGLTPEGVWESPWKDAHDKLFDNISSLGGMALEEATRTVKERYAKIFRKYPKGFPLTESSSLNGVAGVRFFDAVKIKTGKGLPLNGSKESLINETAQGREYNLTGHKAVQHTLRCLIDMTNRGVVANVTFKDELKKEAKPIRTFTAFPATFNEVMRRLSLPIFKIMQENYLLTGMSIGVDVRSEAWGLIAQKHLRKKNHVFFDFKNFDASHNVDIINAALSVFYDLMTIFYHEDATVGGYPWYLIASGGFAFTSHPVYNLDGTILEVDGTLGSGAYITAQLNSVIQEIIVQCLWYSLHPSHVALDQKGGDSFADACVSDRLGDDGMVSTDDPDFNLPFFIKTAMEKWGMVITSPTKDDNCPLTFPVSDWNYLKRGFSRGPLFGKFHWLAPLEFQSIYKSLCYYSYDKRIDTYTAMMERCTSAALELAFHGTEEAAVFYDKLQKALQLVFGPKADGTLHLPALMEMRETYYERSYGKPTHSADALCVRANKDPVEHALTFHSLQRENAT